MVSRAPAEGPSLYCEIDGLPVEVVPSELTAAGVFVQSTTPPAVDDEVELFLSADQDRLTVKGLVVQVIGLKQAAEEKRPPGFGVLFTHLSASQRQWLERTAQQARERAVRAEAKARRVARREARREARSSERKRRADGSPHPGMPRGSLPPRAPPKATAAKPASARSTPTSAPSPEAERILGELQSELDSLRRAPAWKVLGVSADTDPAIAKDAFLKRSKKFHPHLFARYQSQDVSRAATELFIVHKKALTTIERTARASVRPPAGRNAAEPPSLPPDKAGSDPPRRRKPVRRRSTADAEMAVTDGLRLLAAGDFDTARECFNLAVGLDPTSKNAKIWLLLCEARQRKQEGDSAQAIEAYQAVLELDPKHREALEETRGTEPPPKRKGGLLERWFRSGDD